MKKSRNYLGISKAIKKSIKSKANGKIKQYKIK